MVGRSWLLSLLFFTSFSCYAATTSIFDARIQIHGHSDYVTAAFEFSQETDKAGLKVTDYFYDPHTKSWKTETQHLVIEGIHYKKATNQIVLQSHGHSVICANLLRKTGLSGLLNWDYTVVNTGRCQIQLTKELLHVQSQLKNRDKWTAHLTLNQTL